MLHRLWAWLTRIGTPDLLKEDTLCEVMFAFLSNGEVRMLVTKMDVDRGTMRLLVHGMLQAVVAFGNNHGVQMRAHVGDQHVLLADLLNGHGKPVATRYEAG